MAAAAPWVFVLFWSTGFVVARYGTDDAGPFAFLAVRLAIAGALLALFAVATGAPRPTAVQSAWAAVAGLGIHAAYLGGVFLAISWGMPSGVSALIAGLHPVLTSVVGRLVLAERLRGVQWLGVGLGFAGVVAVVAEHLLGDTAGITAAALVASAISVVGMTAGTVVQRRRGSSTPLLWGTAAQYAASSVALAVAAVLHPGERFAVTSRSLFALAWAVGVLSLAAVLIMMWLLQREAAAQVSSLFFLTPALSTIEGAILFGESLGPLAVVGLVTAAVGVWLTMRSTR